MKEDFLSLLRCPSCHTELKASKAKHQLKCKQGHLFSIVDGIPLFAPDACASELFFDEMRQSPSLALNHKKKSKSSKPTSAAINAVLEDWKREYGSHVSPVRQMTKKEFSEQTGLALESLKGKRVLDAGCGGGRFVELLADSNVDVVGVDLSLTGLKQSSRTLKGRNCHFVQGDLFNLPFKEKSFDVIYSLGVLHHTSDPQGAFNSLLRLLKPGGEIAVWVYEKPKHKYFSDYIRPVTVRLPYPVLLGLSYVATGFYGPVLQVPKLGPKMKKVLRDFRLPWQDEWNWRRHNFMDWYGPKYQFKYTPRELRKWFSDKGLSDVVEGKDKVSMRGRLSRPLTDA